VAGALHRSGLTRPERAGRGLLTVLAFHRVLPGSELREYPLGEIAMSVEEFGWLVPYLAAHYTCGTLADVYRRWVGGERPDRPFLAVTFDDGQLDNFEHARPVLDREGVKASFFVPVDAVDGNEPLWHDRLGYAVQRLLHADRARALRALAVLGAIGAPDDHAFLLEVLERAKRLTPEARLELVGGVEAALGAPARPPWDGAMSWEQLRSLSRGGHEVGSHSRSHPILPLVDDAQLEREVAGSKARLEAELGVACEAFCYPNGDCDTRVVEAVRRAGYLRAVTTAWGPNAPGADALRLSRCEMLGPQARNRAGRFSVPRVAFRLSPYFPGPRA
jgi:peptidoglycan/xylan/chitin deacetylase (PgdA/CDA1 family)